MIIILGANGHVGSAAATALLEQDQAVLAVLHSARHEPVWRSRGAETAVVDVHDSDALRAVFQRGRRAFLLNPPGDVAGDTEREELGTVHAIIAALDGSGLEKVVLESTYGAQPGERCGDLNILHEFEQALSRQPIGFAVQRAAYYMSNWDDLLDAAKAGTLPTMIPADLELPMVAPIDLGRAAARRLLEPARSEYLHYVEGPSRYSPRDVAGAFAKALGTPVKVLVTPREQWVEAFRKLGFSQAAAESYAKMTAVSVDGGFPMPETYERGETTLQAYIDQLVARG